MKKLSIILFIALFTVLGSTAQNQNSLRVGLNGAFWGAGDVTGLVFYAEYERTLTPYFALVPRLSSGYSSEHVKGTKEYWSEWSYSSILSTHTASLSLRTTPFQKMSWLKLDAGFLYQHTIISSINFYPDPTIGVAGVTAWDDHLFGILFAVNANIIETERHVFGLRGEMLTYFDAGSFECSGFQFGIYYGVRF